MITMRNKPLVLIVEDDPWICGISSELLEDEGFAVASAPDGEAGLNRAVRLRPAAILLDLGLPHMSFQRAKLRDIRRVADSRLVFRSGWKRSGS